jgi:hypothetical protein
MAASREECVAQFPRQPCCIDRIYARSLAWAAYTTALPLPPADTAPEIAWVRQRVLAEQMPMRSYAQQIAPFLMEVPNITDEVRSHLNAWNDEATETTLATDIDSAFASVMPVFAEAAIGDQEVALWCDKHGYPRPDGLIGVFAPPPVGVV